MTAIIQPAGGSAAERRPAPLPPPRVHPTALIEPGVEIGPGTSIWDNVHVRGPATRIGPQCIVGEKTYIAYGVEIGARVKINAMVYICAAVSIEDGVMVSAGTIFTNDRFPRATTPDLRALRPSDPDEHTRPTRVREGATLGAGSIIGSDLVIGRFAMVGMGSVVTRSVPDFHLVVGSPACSIACVCRCGEPFLRFSHHAEPPDCDDTACPICGLRYAVQGGQVTELAPPR
jgi:acetyltransferase-like isoleucine patch superfamily enzyme